MPIGSAVNTGNGNGNTECSCQIPSCQLHPNLPLPSFSLMGPTRLTAQMLFSHTFEWVCRAFDWDCRTSPFVRICPADMICGRPLKDPLEINLLVNLLTVILDQRKLASTKYPCPCRLQTHPHCE